MLSKRKMIGWEFRQIPEEIFTPTLKVKTEERRTNKMDIEEDFSEVAPSDGAVNVAFENEFDFTDRTSSYILNPIYNDRNLLSRETAYSLYRLLLRSSK